VDAFERTDKVVLARDGRVAGDSVGAAISTSPSCGPEVTPPVACALF